MDQPKQEDLFTETDARNLIVLLNKTPIVGGESDVVTILKMKLNTLLPKPEQEIQEPKQDK